MNRSDEGLISVRWSIYIINSVDKTNFRVLHSWVYFDRDAALALLMEPAKMNDNKQHHLKMNLVRSCDYFAIFFICFAFYNTGEVQYNCTSVRTP